MANCISYCDAELLEHSIVNCDEFFAGGGTQMILFGCGSEPSDPTDGAEILALIAAGTARKIAGNIKFTMPEASAITVDPTDGCSTEITINYDRTLEVIDYNVTADNVDFYNDLNGRRFGAALLLECAAERTTFINPTGGITTAANRNFPETNTELQNFAITFGWRSKAMPTIHNLPTPDVF
jgi:hypothetical protein